MIIKLSIKTKINDLNTKIRKERGNKFKSALDKKKSTNDIAWEIISQTKIIIDCKVDLVFVYYTKSKCDPDNLYSKKKEILDGMQRAGIIYSDDDKHIGSILDMKVKSNFERIDVYFYRSSDGVLTFPNIKDIKDGSNT